MNQIHSLGIILPVVEWVFIFIPMLFHGIVGLMIISSGMPNASAYPYNGNIRYTLQRATGMIVFVFIVWHVIQMHHMGLLLGGRKIPGRRSDVFGCHHLGSALDSHPLRHWSRLCRLSPCQRTLDAGHHLGNLDDARGHAAGGIRLLWHSACSWAPSGSARSSDSARRYRKGPNDRKANECACINAKLGETASPVPGDQNMKLAIEPQRTNEPRRRSRLNPQNRQLRAVNCQAADIDFANKVIVHGETTGDGGRRRAGRAGRHDEVGRAGHRRRSDEPHAGQAVA